jgi:hypothetical protein
VIEAGGLPSVCPRHGLPATGLITRTFHKEAPVWLWPFLIVWAPISVVFYDQKTRVRCAVPVCSACARGRARSQFVAVGLCLALVLDMVLAAAGIAPSVAVILLLPLIVAAPVAAISGPNVALPNGRLTRDGLNVRFKPVADRFRAVVDHSPSHGT